MRYQFFLFFKNYTCELLDISKWKKMSLHTKNQHPIVKIIRFRTLSSCFPIWTFQWGFNFFIFFQKLYIWVEGYSRMKKTSLHANNQHSNGEFIHFRTIFLIPQKRNFDFKMQKLQLSIKSIIPGLGIKQNLFWKPQSINFMKITTKNTGMKFC